MEANETSGPYGLGYEPWGTSIVRGGEVVGAFDHARLRPAAVGAILRAMNADANEPQEASSAPTAKDELISVLHYDRFLAAVLGFGENPDVTDVVRKFKHYLARTEMNSHLEGWTTVDRNGDVLVAFVEDDSEYTGIRASAVTIAINLLKILLPAGASATISGVGHE